MHRLYLIAGCGYLGRRLASRLGSQGRVIALVRTHASAVALQEAGLEARVNDLDADAPAATLATVAQDAAIAYLAPPPDAGTTDPRLDRFLAALGESRPAVLVYVSTTGVYGDTGGSVVDETSPLAPTNDRSRRRVAAEEAVRRWCDARGVRWVVLRVPGIYGPGRLPLERLQRGEPALCAADSGPANRIHVDDLVAACTAALDRPVHGVFNVGDGDHSSTTTFLQATAELAGLPPPELVSLAEARGRISPGMLAYLVESRRVDTRRMRSELGVVPRYPAIAAGVAASLEEMRTRAR